MGDPGLWQGPGAGHAFADGGWLCTSSTGELAQARTDGLAEHRTKRAVARGGGGDAAAQGGDIGIGSTVDGRNPQLSGHIHEQLVTARGHTVGQLFDRIGIVDLIQTDLIGKREQRHDGFGGGEAELAGRGSAASAGIGVLVRAGACRHACWGCSG